MATVQAVLTGLKVEPPEFDAYLALCIVWDQGECTPSAPYYTTGPLIPLTNDTPPWWANSVDNPAQWTARMHYGETDDVDVDDFADNVAQAAREQGLSYEEMEERFYSRIPARPRLNPKFDLIIDPTELLLTDKDVIAIVLEGISCCVEANGISSIECLGNGCPYPGQWYSRAAIVFWPKAHQELLRAKLTEQASRKRSIHDCYRDRDF